MFVCIVTMLIIVTQTKRLIVVNDLHAGSHFSLHPPEWKMIGGDSHKPNEAQTWLFNRYVDCIKEFGKPDYLLGNGDLTDGSQHLNYSREVWATNPADQVKLAKYEVDLWKAKVYFGTIGSRYHVESGATFLERQIAEKLKAREFGFAIKPTIEGKRCNFAHEIPVSTSSWQYRTTAAARALVLDRLQKADKSANLLIRSHAHYYCHVGFSDQLAIISPAWQGQTPYTARKMPEVISKVGVVCIDLPEMDFSARTFDGPELATESFEHDEE